MTEEEIRKRWTELLNDPRLSKFDRNTVKAATYAYIYGAGKEVLNNILKREQREENK